MANQIIPKLMAMAGVSLKIKALYVPDYMAFDARVEVQQILTQRLKTQLPEYELSLALSMGPFEDDDMNYSHFDKEALTHTKLEQRTKSLRVDLHTSVIQLARNVEIHRPEIIIGEGQGAIWHCLCSIQ